MNAIIRNSHPGSNASPRLILPSWKRGDGPARPTIAPETPASTPKRLLLANLLLLFAITSFGIAQASGGMRLAGVSGGSAEAVQTVREFYLDLNNYMATGELGELDNVMLPDAYGPAPAAGVTSADAGFADYLLALRAACPGMTFSIEKIETAADSAIVRVRNSCPHALESAGVAGKAEWTSSEMFRVRDGKVWQHWSSGAGMTPTYVPNWLDSNFRVAYDGKLAVARIALWPSSEEYLVLPGPAVVFIQSGEISVMGNGIVELVAIAAGTSAVIEPGTKGKAGDRTALIIPRGTSVIRNQGQETASLLFVGVVSVPISSEPIPHASRKEIDDNGGNDGSLQWAILGQAGMNVGITNGIVYPIAVAAEVTPFGPVNLDLSWTVIPTAMVSVMDTGTTGLLSIPITGEVVASDNVTGTTRTIQNTGVSPALVLNVTITHSANRTRINRQAARRDRVRSGPPAPRRYASFCAP